MAYTYIYRTNVQVMCYHYWIISNENLTIVRKIRILMREKTEVKLSGKNMYYVFLIYICKNIFIINMSIYFILDFLLLCHSLNRFLNISITILFVQLRNEAGM